MLNIAIFGAPGSGKGTQSKNVVDKYDLYHISTGDILRKEIKNGTKLGLDAVKYTREGQLVPDEIIIDMFAGILDKTSDSKGYVFDGFPRTISQAQALDKILRARNMSTVAVLWLSVDDKILVDRMIKRGEMNGRIDDTPETIQKRLSIYKEQTEPVKEYYRKMGKLLKINGDDSIENVFDHIIETIDRLLF